ncbi:hypothetical protein SDC9_08485 [bioreactor metagenome]|uniref:Uncharacterized protein n=1 Tax=bioreactor metagenome TaxID=1076179 RepID=A0A644T7F3_9ZZZZ|nr:hypothetical protein [Methanobrevibacter sp.]MEA4957212.1 hypothetical protein [Methanobrevibacter sp.]
MNKKNKIGIIIIIILLIAIAGFLISIMNSAIVVNDVAGVDNVELNSSLFSKSGGILENAKDDYHAQNGDFFIKYLQTGDTITFSNTSEKYNETDFYSDSGWIVDDGYTVYEPMTIAGIKGYYITDNEKAINENMQLGDVFVFVMNDKVYTISVSNENETFPSLLLDKEGINLLLNAWLKASGFKQTWNYPETISDVDNKAKIMKSNEDSNQSEGNTKVINGVIYTKEEDGLIYELHPGDPGYEKEIKKYK